MPPVAAIVILGIIVGGIIYFLVRVYRTPRKIESIATLVKRGKAATAVRMARALINRDPRSCELHYLLGLAYLAEKKPELAFVELKTVNQLSAFGPYCPEIEFRHRIAVLYERFGDAEEALKEYLLLTRLEPGDATNYYNAGRIFEQRGNRERAVTYLRKAIELDPTHADAHYRLGVELYGSQASPEARSELEAAVHAQPDNYRAHFYLGRLLRDNREYLAALQSFELASRDKEIKVAALVERGACYLSVNSPDKAVSELERAIRLAEDDSTTEVLHGRYLLAQCYERLHELDKAIEQWEKIYQRRPSFRDVAQKLAQYQEVRSDDRIMDYLTVTAEMFEEICKSIVVSMGLTVRDVTQLPDGCQIVAVEDESKWRNTRKLPTLIRFFRLPDTLQETTTRALYEEMRKLGIARGMIVASSPVSRKAVLFAETRPIDLIGRNRLMELLKAAEPSWSK